MTPGRTTGKVELAPVVFDATARGAYKDGTPEPHRPGPEDTAGLPVARLEGKRRPARYRYFVATTVDSRGRLADRAPVKALGWTPGMSVTISVDPTTAVIVVRRSGPSAITRQGHVRLPAPVRRRCYLSAGQRLLVVAVPEHDLLLLYTAIAVEQMLSDYHLALSGGEHDGQR